jgi:hypothetical protein
MLLAERTRGNIVAVDLVPDFIAVLNDKARSLGLEERVQGLVGSMAELDFKGESLDLIWSEGAIDNIGFAKGLEYWKGFLGPSGHVAVTCPSWLSDERPAEVESFWADAGVELNTVANNIGVMQELGYGFVAAFALTEECWTDNYFAPRQAAEQAVLDKYGQVEVVEEYIANSNYEVDLYIKHGRHYGYVFYIGKAI